jgi:preprotein translocase subunit SecB
MKTSPLQLKWVAYPSISFQAIPNTTNDEPIATTASGTVTYLRDGSHTAMLELKSNEGANQAYIFALTVIGVFSFDLQVAKQTYTVPNESLPRTLAVNLSRLLYSGAREMLAQITARAPHGSAILESVLLEASDINIQLDGSAEEILPILFMIGETGPVARKEKPNPALDSIEPAAAVKKKTKSTNKKLK